MANEISINVTMSCRNGSLVHQFAPGTIQVNQTTQGAVDNVQSIGTTAENIYTGDLVAPGYLEAHNLDATNFVELGKQVSGSFEKFADVPPGKTSGPFRIASGVTLQAKADTAACKVRFIIYDR